MTYVLDEPSIGLHHRDKPAPCSTPCAACGMWGNAVIVVEHDEDAMRRADRVVDFAPARGTRAGRWSPRDRGNRWARRKHSVTGAYLSGKKKIDIPQRRAVSDRGIWIRGARQNNLKDIDVKIPLGAFTCVTRGIGVGQIIAGRGYSLSGPGVCVESRRDGDWRAPLHRGHRPDGQGHRDRPTAHRRTPRSNAATYTGAFDPIRKLFAELPESKVRGHKPGVSVLM